MSDRELMQQAKEDIETLFGLAINEVDGWARSATAEEIVMRLSALRARLAEPDDEPALVFNGERGAEAAELFDGFNAGTRFYTRPAELLRQEALIAELAGALEACSQYLVCIPESAAGGDDEARRINRRAIAALAKVQQ